MFSQTANALCFCHSTYVAPHCNKSSPRRHRRASSVNTRARTSRGVKIMPESGLRDFDAMAPTFSQSCANFCAPSRAVANRTIEDCDPWTHPPPAGDQCRGHLAKHPSAAHPRTPRLPDIPRGREKRRLAFSGSHVSTRSRRTTGAWTAHSLKAPRPVVTSSCSCASSVRVSRAKLARLLLSPRRGPENAPLA